ncbi:MAG: PilZ domain-containing protein [Candidatus Omnitrophica bacterium]|nr:PilZ domain-containing protein [Candidatus Omnitrophota bacterium]MCM8825957.1 PilZ domain-containing protein [Candidatus Omnitrophota bacterium]
MDNRRRFLRFEVGDFLEIRPLNETGRYVEGQSFNLSIMGICFSSKEEWQTGQVLLIDYFITKDLDSVKLKVVVVWSEFIDEEKGYLTGAQIIDVEQAKEERFINYYYQRLKEKFF